MFDLSPMVVVVVVAILEVKLEMELEDIEAIFGSVWQFLTKI